MTIRLFGALLCGAALILAAQTGLAYRAAAQSTMPGYTGGRGGGFHIGDNASPLPQDRRTNRAGSGIGKQTIFDRWGRATTVKSSKSNSSDRMGGGGGKGSTKKFKLTNGDFESPRSTTRTANPK